MGSRPLEPDPGSASAWFEENRALFECFLVDSEHLVGLVGESRLGSPRLERKSALLQSEVCLQYTRAADTLKRSTNIYHLTTGVRLF